jgi:CheY-like chemotaxis protein
MSDPFRITLADDDPELLLRAQTAISKHFPHATFSAFSSAEQALDHILHAGADLLVTNHVMGGMSGIELIRRLREHGFQIPIIMVSGSEKAERPAREAGATHFINKDDADRELCPAIEKFLPR